MATTSARREQIVSRAVQGFDGPTIAKHLNLSVRTVRRYLADPATRAQMRELEADRLRDLSRRTGALAGSAVVILGTIANDKAEPAGARVGAATRIVELAIRLAEHVDLAERVAALEATMQPYRRQDRPASLGHAGVVPWPRSAP